MMRVTEIVTVSARDPWPTRDAVIVCPRGSDCQVVFFESSSLPEIFGDYPQVAGITGEIYGCRFQAERWYPVRADGEWGWVKDPLQAAQKRAENARNATRTHSAVLPWTGGSCVYQDTYGPRLSAHALARELVIRRASGIKTFHLPFADEGPCRDIPMSDLHDDRHRLENARAIMAALKPECRPEFLAFLRAEYVYLDITDPAQWPEVAA